MNILRLGTLAFNGTGGRFGFLPEKRHDRERGRGGFGFCFADDVRENTSSRRLAPDSITRLNHGALIPFTVSFFFSRAYFSPLAGELVRPERRTRNRFSLSRASGNDCCPSVSRGA